MTKKNTARLMVAIFLLCLPLNIWLMFYHMVLKDSTAIQTGYVDSMSYSGEDEKFFIEAEYFPNEYGAKLNYYTDTKIPEKNEDGSYGKKYTYSTGVQFEGGVKYGDQNVPGFWSSTTSKVLNDGFYYNSDDFGNTFTAISELSDRNSWVYDINGELVLIQEIGYRSVTAFLGWTVNVYHGTSNMIIDLYDSIKSLEDGTHIVTMDLSKYYTFTLYNETTKKFENKLEDENILQKYIFVNVKVTKSSNDFVSANQSTLFGMFKGDKNWTLYDFEKADYWRARNEYNLTIKDFTFTYTNEAYYLKLLPYVAEFLSEFKNMKYIVTIDLDKIYLGSQTIDIKGFDKQAFGSLGIDKIKLTTTQIREFETCNNYNIEHPENLTIKIVKGGEKNVRVD